MPLNKNLRSEAWRPLESGSDWSPTNTQEELFHPPTSCTELPGEMLRTLLGASLAVSAQQS